MSNPQHSRHLAFGLLGAVLGPVLALLVYSSITAGFRPSLDDWLGVGVILVTTGAFVGVGVFALGLPIVMWLRAHRRLNWWTVLGASTIAGAIYMALLGWFFSSGTQFPLFQASGSGALLGLCSGIGFCLGAGPNNSFKPKPLRGSA